LFGKSIDHRLAAAKGVGGFHASLESIKDPGFITGADDSNGLTSREEDTTSDPTDLTHRKCLSPPFAIARNSDHTTVTANSNGGGKTGTHDKPNQAQPKYMRLHMLDSSRGSADSWPDRLDEERVSVAFPLGDCDIDASYDRKHWFHLFGAECVRNERPFNPKSPQ
jgi:hypothetical protein